MSQASALASSLTVESILASSDQKIHLPVPLLADLPTAAKTLLAIDAEGKKTVSFARTFPGFHPADVGVVFMRLLAETFGFVAKGSESSPPMLYQIPTSLTTSEPMVFGKLKVPGLSDSVDFNIRLDFYGPMPSLMIHGTSQQKALPAVNGILDRLAAELPARSIYRGKAVKVSWEWQRRGLDYSIPDHSPKFLDLSRSDFSNLVFSDETSRQIAANLVLPITQGDRWTSLGFSRKTGVLMQGPPGCGKTETLLYVAGLCQSHGWTYIQCESVEDLELATLMALNYQPAVVAVEDIDKATGGRSISVDSLLNTIDGTEAKGRNILFVATTNDVDSITEAMLRPGRLGDGFIYMGPPDAGAAERLVRRLAGSSLEPGSDLSEVADRLAGSLPAVIVATVQSARKYALVRTTMVSDLIAPDDLLASFAERTTQTRLLTKTKPDTRPDLIKAAEVIATAIGGASEPTTSRLSAPMPNGHRVGV